MNNTEAGNVVFSNATIDGDPGTIIARFDEETGNGESAHPTESLGLVGFELGQLVCFTPGTLIETPHGPREITSLRKGDLVLTADAGPQSLLLSSHTHIAAPQLARDPDLCPILLRRGALAPGVPSRDLLVSPQHRLLLSDWRANLLFGAAEMLPAKGLLNDHSVLRHTPQQGIDYIHLGFAAHQIITANGAPTESLHAGTLSKSALSDAARHELFTLFPELRTQPANWANAARPCLNVREAGLLAPSLSA